MKLKEWKQYSDEIIFKVGFEISVKFQKIELESWVRGHDRNRIECKKNV